MAENLRPEGIPVTVGTVRISTPGLAGRVEVYQSGTAGMRGAESGNRGQCVQDVAHRAEADDEHAH